MGTVLEVTTMNVPKTIQKEIALELGKKPEQLTGRDYRRVKELCLRGKRMISTGRR